MYSRPHAQIEQVLLNALAGVARGEVEAVRTVTEALKAIDPLAVRGLGFLITALLKHERDDVKLGAIESFTRARHASPNAIGILTEVARGNDTQLRGAAVEALKMIPQDDAFRGLLHLLRDTKDEELQPLLVPALRAHIERKSTLLAAAVDELKAYVDLDAPPFSDVIKALTDATTIRSTVEPGSIEDLSMNLVPPFDRMSPQGFLAGLSAPLSFPATFPVGPLGDERLRRVERLICNGIDFEALLDMEADLAVELEKAGEELLLKNPSLGGLQLPSLSFQDSQLTSFLDFLSQNVGSSPSACAGLAIHLTHSLRGSRDPELKERLIKVLDAMNSRHLSGAMSIVMHICKIELRAGEA